MSGGKATPEDAAAGDQRLGAGRTPDEDEIVDESHDNVSYKEVSEISDVTQESYPEGYIVFNQGSQANAAVIEDLVDFAKLKQQTEKKLEIAESEQEAVSQISSGRQEDADEFLRNFFIKFGMQKTLNSFQ